MKLYNTLTKKVEQIKPQHPPVVTIYTCGPTVYDYPHIGNWFTFLRYDLLVRTLRANAYEPKWVMNITDVGHLVSDADEGEDKLEKGARREHKTAWEVAEYYSSYFINGLARLNIMQPNMLPKATHHIKEQIELILRLEAKGYTYQIEDGIYFDTSKFPRYGDFAQLDIDELQAGARVEVNPEKRNPTDFALWKFSPKDSKRDMEWPSPWGTGFPGWHIECSAMSMKYLGETLDVHSGGIDHIPVHHTNEIAQSEAVTGKRFANYWMHTNHITISGEKIAKSAGNGLTLEDIEAKGYDLEVFRLLVLESHYRTQSTFSWEAMEAAANRLQDLRAMAVLRWQPQHGISDYGTFSFEDVPQEIGRLMSEDLNSPAALAFLSQVSTQLSTVLVGANGLDHFILMLRKIDELLGLKLSDIGDITPEQKQLIAKREESRLAKDWASADRVRQELLKQGVGVRDTPYGPIWFPERLQ
ncbi:MAG TPA: cysteine--tRNA ligase [Candidatus Saccharimonadales bacterium]|nr:cysteine--tRNA ligase [Candidatus Saccharimonadales bacterium]